MSKPLAVLLCCLPLAAAHGAGPPRHVFSASEPLTAPSPAPARALAREFIGNLAAAHGLEVADLAGLYVAKEYRTAHNGVTHLVYRQQFQGLDVYNAEWTVNIDRDGRVLNAGGELLRKPPEGVSAASASSAPAALRAAIGAVRPGTSATYLPLQDAAGKSGQRVRFARQGLDEQIEGQPVWYRIGGVLRPAWVFYILDENGVDNYATVVDAETERILAKDNLTYYQAPPRGLVFERQSPQPHPSPGLPLTSPPPYVERTLQSFAGDPHASPRGWLSGIATVGNNVVAEHNPLGIRFLEDALPAISPARDFSFPLELGPGAPNPLRFRDAATTNLFYWANRCHDLFYELGFDETAGNFQQDNFGRGGTGGDPMIAFSHFGAAAQSSASLNNAFFTTSRDGEDGARASINIYLGASRPDGVFSDGSFDAGVIIHEYTHGVSNRLVRQFRNHQGGAMGEGWSDFFALEFTTPEGAPPDGSYPQGEYLFQSFGAGIRTRPYSTNMEINPLTYHSLGRVRDAPQVHADGEIWVQALWEMRANLIRQFGEKEGRRRTRLLVIDGMKLSPPAPTMVDARDAILLADRVTFDGASQPQIWAAFAKRGLGVLAHSASADSIHILASFESPSSTGAMRFYEKYYVMGETVRIVLHDANFSAPGVRLHLTTASGDLESLLLRRTGSLYWGSIRTSSTTSVSKMNGALEVIPWDFITAYYLDWDAGGAAQLLEVTVQVHPDYVATTTASQPPIPSPDEKPLFTIPANARTSGLSVRVSLPFPFPFFGRSYTWLRVYGDGLLAFDLPLFAACSDRESLALTNGIAPMWMDLAYGGAAQKDENVFMSSGPGWVAFRWAAETQPFSGLNLRPEPVSFSATLFDDGRIQLHYGEGNRNLTSSASAPLFGCVANAPTVGISNGHETYALVASAHDGRPTLENAPGVAFDPPFGHSTVPVVQLESPAPAGRYQGLLTVRGIAYDEGSPITRLDVLIDGVARARPSVNASRPDFCATQKVRGCPLVGFSTNLDTARLGLAPGEHTLRVRATNSRGGFQDYPEEPVTFFVDAEQARPAAGAVETPTDGAELSGIVQVKGYAYATDLRLRGVDVLIDGVTYGAATYYQRRDDICGPLEPRPPNCPNIGFSFNLDTKAASVPLPNGQHTLQVRARDEIDRYTLIPETPLTVTINNPPNRLPTGALASPKTNQRLSGKVRISGHAWDPDGQIASVVLLINGSSFLTLRYGLPRSEECQQLPEVRACPDIGFEGELDTTQLANGPHVLGIRLTDNDGATAVIPKLLRNGMNIFIEN